MKNIIQKIKTFFTPTKALETPIIRQEKIKVVDKPIPLPCPYPYQCSPQPICPPPPINSLYDLIPEEQRKKLKREKTIKKYVLFVDGKMVVAEFDTIEEAENVIFNTNNLLCFQENVLWKIEEWNCTPNENYDMLKQKTEDIINVNGESCKIIKT